jgi:hypothetical protein
MSQVKTVYIRTGHVVERVIKSQKRHGDRNVAEAAERMILDQYEREISIANFENELKTEKAPGSPAS